MRDLTKKQKNLLIKWFKESESSEGKMLLGKTNSLNGFEDLSLEQINMLEQINDTEVLYQNVNSFLHDLRFNEV